MSRKVILQLFGLSNWRELKNYKTVPKLLNRSTTISCIGISFAKMPALIIQSLADHMADNEPFDDITLMVIHYI